MLMRPYASLYMHAVILTPCCTYIAHIAQIAHHAHYVHHDLITHIAHIAQIAHKQYYVDETLYIAIHTHSMLYHTLLKSLKLLMTITPVTLITI